MVADRGGDVQNFSVRSGTLEKAKNKSMSSLKTLQTFCSPLPQKSARLPPFYHF
mgnify:CR=1 FL=1